MSKAAFFVWNEKMSVNSKELDQQHQNLINMLNDLYQAFMEKEHKERIGSIIEKMTEYAVYHFDAEEKYFGAFDYDKKVSHEMEHEDFRRKVGEFTLKYKANSGALTFEVVNFLRSWLNNHIMETDKGYAEFFRK
jgi:hemerythrin-like metal-binding protein